MAESKLEIPRVFFRVDVHFKIGMGHVTRCLNLALKLRDRLNIEPHFLMLGYSLRTGFDRNLEMHDIPFSLVSSDNEYQENFKRTQDLLKSHRPAVVVTDLLSPDPGDRDLLDDEDLIFQPVPTYVEKLRDLKVPTVSITDEIERIDIRPDVVIGASCHNPAERYDQVSGTRFLLGPDYFLIGSDFEPYTGLSKTVPDRASRILIIFGGSDPDLFSVKVMDSLWRDKSFRISVVLGPAVQDPMDVSKKLERMGAEVFHGIPSVARLMYEADIAVTAGGNTTFELAAVGTPAISMCTRERQFKNAEFFQRQGTLLNMSLGRDVGGTKIRDAVLALASDRDRRMGMSKAGRRTIDGKGVDRVCGVIREYFN